MKKIISTIALTLVVVLVGSILLQFGYNMLFVTPYAAETTKGGDGKLTDMLFESDTLDDAYFNDVALISENLEGAIERIDIREDCADFTACGLIRFYLENKHRLASENKDEIKRCLTDFKYWMDQHDGRVDSMCHWSENHQILFATTEYLAGAEWPDAVFADGKTGAQHIEMPLQRKTHFTYDSPFTFHFISNHFNLLLNWNQIFTQPVIAPSKRNIANIARIIITNII